MTENDWLVLLLISAACLLVPYAVGLLKRRRNVNFEDLFALIFSPAAFVSGAKMSVLSWQLPNALKDNPAATLLDVPTILLSGIVVVLFTMATAVRLLQNAWKQVPPPAMG